MVKMSQFIVRDQANSKFFQRYLNCISGSYIILNDVAMKKSHYYIYSPP